MAAESESQEPATASLGVIEFATDSAELNDQAKALLDKAAEIVRDDGDSVVQLHGHADSTGARQYNQQLSEQRAQAALDYHVDVYGIPADRYVVAGFGEDQPIADIADDFVGRIGHQHLIRCRLVF